MSNRSQSLYRTALDAERCIKSSKEKALAETVKGQLYTSTNQLIIDLDKVVELLDEETYKKTKTLIDNLYYHVGAVKGCI